jgi:hypothetical protein
VALTYAAVERARSVSSTLWGPVGRFAWRQEHLSYAGTSLNHALESEIAQQVVGWLLVRRGLFGGSVEVLREAKANIERLAQQVQFR